MRNSNCIGTSTDFDSMGSLRSIHFPEGRRGSSNSPEWQPKHVWPSTRSVDGGLGSAIDRGVIHGFAQVVLMYADSIRGEQHGRLHVNHKLD